MVLTILIYCNNMISVLKTIKNEFIYYFIAFCLISNAIVFIPNRMVFYMIGISLLALYSIKNNKSSNNGNIFLMFYGACLLL